MPHPTFGGCRAAALIWIMCGYNWHLTTGTAEARAGRVQKSGGTDANWRQSAVVDGRGLPGGFSGSSRLIPASFAAGGARAWGYGGWYRAQLARPADAGQPQRRNCVWAKLFTADKGRTGPEPAEIGLVAL